MTKFESRQLAADGLVSARSKFDPEGTEAIVARTYGAPALGDRVVVELSAERLGPAVDLAMDYLGLESRDVSAPLARQSKRALGFAHWALTHHPDNAKYALNLVKRIKAAARRAKSKPGHAWDEFSQMASEFDKAVPYFLPSFWEEAARIFKNLSNNTYAARSFNKALVAERVHALEIDRDHRREAVLEFTLGGCLSGKALSEYTKDLQTQFDPQEAYETLRDLVVRRTLGGMPPTATMGKDLSTLAKAAGLEPEVEIVSVLEEIIISPSMSRAPWQFWKSVSKSVKRLVDAHPTFAVWLLCHTDPKPEYDRDSLVWKWIDLLESWNVLPWLWREDLPSEPEIPGGRAGWIGRLARVETSPSKRAFELLERMAPVIAKERKPIPLFGTKGKQRIDADVLEACLALDLPLEAFPQAFELDFDGWLRVDRDHERRNSSLVHIGADDLANRALRRALPVLIKFQGELEEGGWGRKLAPRRSFEDAAADHPFVQEARWRYVEEQLIRLENGGVCDADIALDRLQDGIGRVANHYPEIIPRLEEIDLADNLHRALKAGVLDEYGWRILDQAVEQHPIASEVHRYCYFPFASYLSAENLVIVKPDGFDVHPLALKKNQALQIVLPVGDDVAIAYKDRDTYKDYIRWLSDPKRDCPTDSYIYYFRPRYLGVMEDGVFIGQSIIRPGDIKIGERQFWHDGHRFWIGESHVHTSRGLVFQFSEVDPESAKRTRESVPAWLEQDIPPGSRLWLEHTDLQVAPPSMTESPLGIRDGLIGWKLFQRRDGFHEGIGIDGRRVDMSSITARGMSETTPLAMMDQPTGGSHWVFTDEGVVFDSQSGVCIARVNRDHSSYSPGQPFPVLVPFLHHMSVRDPKVSKRLRRLKRSVAGQLFEAAKKHVQVQDEKPFNEKSDVDVAPSEVLRLMGTVSKPLVKGIAGIAKLAASQHKSLQRLIAEISEDLSSEVPSATDLARIDAGFIQLQSRRVNSHYRDREAKDSVCFGDAVSFLGDGKSRALSMCSSPWFLALSDLPLSCWTTFWRLATKEDEHPELSDRIQQPWLNTLEFIASSGLFDLEGNMWLHDGAFEDGVKSLPKEFSRAKTNAWCFSESGSRYVGFLFSDYRLSDGYVLEYRPKGKSRVPKKFLVSETLPIQLGWTRDELREFVASVRTLQSLPFLSTEELDRTAKALGVTPVEVAVTWMGDLRTVNYGDDKLTREIRSRYGWKVKPVQEAIAALGANPLPNAVIGAAIRTDPWLLTRSDRSAALKKMQSEWKKIRTKEPRLAPDLIHVFEKSVQMPWKSSTTGVTDVFGNLSQSELMRPRTSRFVRNTARHEETVILDFTPKMSEPIDGLFHNVCASIRLFNYVCPVGDPARRRLPELITALRQWLDDEKTVLPFGYTWVIDRSKEYDVNDVLERYKTVLSSLQESDGIHYYDDDLMSVALCPPNVGSFFRPARMRTSDDVTRIVQVSGLSRYYDETGESEVANARLVFEVRSEAFSEIAAQNADPEIPQGCWDQDPRLSAPKALRDLRRKYDLDEDAATLYLQLLALPDPTNVNIRKWNGFSPAKFKATTASLLETDLVVEAKRPRAGRSVFLPGGWEALKAPNLPIETWKLPLFALTPDTLQDIRFHRIVPVGSVKRLFEVAWSRIESGDIPKYEDV